jgi:hypothetical protein
MAEQDCTLYRTTYDPVSGNLKFYFAQPPPPPPADSRVNPSNWWADDATFTVEVRAPKSLTTTGKVVYLNETDGKMYTALLVNGVWQLPGTPVPPGG